MTADDMDVCASDGDFGSPVGAVVSSQDTLHRSERERMQTARVQARQSLMDVSDSIGVPVSLLSGYERGEETLSPTTKKRMLAYLRSV